MGSYLVSVKNELKSEFQQTTEEPLTLALISAAVQCIWGFVFWQYEIFNICELEEIKKCVDM